MPVTIQATGKVHKLIQLLGVVLICAGVVSCTAEAYGSMTLLSFFGVVLWLVGRATAWWFHG